MPITVTDPAGAQLAIDAMTGPQIHNELSAALTAMQPRDLSPGFYQVHHTKLDPNLSEVPDPPIVVNGIPYFYITTLPWINGRILYWRYWWFDSHHHPNWYYARYRAITQTSLAAPLADEVAQPVHRRSSQASRRKGAHHSMGLYYIRLLLQAQTSRSDLLRRHHLPSGHPRL